jgi:uncharacterized protein (DUF2252 family)
MPARTSQEDHRRRTITARTAVPRFQASLAAPDARYDRGVRIRQRVARSAHAAVSLAKQTPQDRLAILAIVNAGRLPSLLPEKVRRMRGSPFAFFRGAAVLMAADLASGVRTGITAQLCGDAHVRNLGAYAGPGGTLVFDLNDFDETINGPWEWDVKRLATSLILTCEESALSARVAEACVRAFAASYRAHLNTFAALPFTKLARYFITRRPDEPVLQAIFADAERTTPRRNLEKLAAQRGGRFGFHDRPPVLEHVSDRQAAEVLGGLDRYRTALTGGRRRTFDRYRPVDVAFKLVGTGSVGTRDYVVLLFGNGVRDPLFMQVKQELASCYVPFLPQPRGVVHQGQRVAEGQQMMQTWSDPFLGYTRFGGHDYLVRQLADHKACLDPDSLTRQTAMEYAGLCGEALAKGHARTTDSAVLAGYLGQSAKFDRALVEFAVTYADQTRADYVAFVRSLRSGRRRAGR